MFCTMCFVITYAILLKVPEIALTPYTIIDSTKKIGVRMDTYVWQYVPQPCAGEFIRILKFVLA